MAYHSPAVLDQRAVLRKVLRILFAPRLLAGCPNQLCSFHRCSNIPTISPAMTPRHFRDMSDRPHIRRGPASQPGPSILTCCLQLVGVWESRSRGVEASRSVDGTIVHGSDNARPFLIQFQDLVRMVVCSVQLMWLVSADPINCLPNSQLLMRNTRANPQKSSRHSVMRGVSPLHPPFQCILLIVSFRLSAASMHEN